MEWFFNGKADSIEDIFYRWAGVNSRNDIIVEVEFLWLQKTINRMKSDTHKKKLETFLGGIDEVKVRRIWSVSEGGEKLELWNPQERKWDNTLWANTGWVDFFPNFEYINTRKYYDEVSKFASKSPVGKMLSAVLTTILENDPNYRDFQAQFNNLFWWDSSEVKKKFDELWADIQRYLMQHFPDCTRVGFNVTQPNFEDLLKNFDTTVNDGIETKASEKGDGMQRALMLSIIQAYSDFRKRTDTIGKNFLFFIDEAEIHLHPTAQRNLKEALLSLTGDGDQVFITTHSSVLIANEVPKQSIFRVEKKSGSTDIVSLKEGKKPDVIYELLWWSPSDLLLPRNFIIVEGSSDQSFVGKMLERFYPEEGQKIQIICAKSEYVAAEKIIDAIEKTFTPLNCSIYKDKFVVILDSPNSSNQSGFDDFKWRKERLFNNNQIHIIPFQSLEEYYPAHSRKTSEEVSRMSGKEKTVLANTVGWQISESEFKIWMSVIKDAIEKSIRGSFSI